MSIRILHRFNQLAFHCYTMQLVEGQKDIVGVLIAIKGETPNDDKVAFVLIDLQKQASMHTIVYRSESPEGMLATDILLRYDAPQKRWVIAQRQNLDYIAMRTLSDTHDGEFKLSPLCLLDHDDAAESPGMNPLLALQINNDRYSFLYPKPFDVHLTAPRVTRLDVTLQQFAWDEWEEPIVLIHSNAEAVTDTYTLPDLFEEVVLPINVSFDPGTFHAHSTPAVHVVEKITLAEAELSMIYTDAHTRLLVLCSPESRVKQRTDTEQRLERQANPQWRISLTGWDACWTQHQWTYSPALGLPVDASIATYEYPSWPLVDVAVITGPWSSLQDSSTIVALIAMLNEEQGVLLSHGVCLTQDGQVIQTCTSSLGRYPSICCCEQMVIGVDRVQEGWRLWNWRALQQDMLGTIITLDASCQRAFVHGQPTSTRFWLIEELADGVRVSYRDALTLAEVSSPTYLVGANLLPSQEDNRPLDGYRDSGSLLYQETLLLIVQEKNGKFTLFQIFG